MNKDQVRGKMENLKGRAKAATGALTGNKQKEGEGQVERIKGAIRQTAGDARSALNRRVDKSRR